jgi:antitoxin VapB
MAKTAKTNAQDGTRSKVAKLFRNGRSQAVRLPKEFRFEGDRVRLRRVTTGVLLEPMSSDPAEWLAEIKKIDAPKLFPKGLKKRKPPIRKYFD